MYNYDITLYTDDAVISVTQERCMHEALLVLSAWCVTNSLTDNESNTKWMLFHFVDHINPVFKLNGVVIERVKEFKYLGLTIDPDMKFVSHRKNVSNNLRNKIHQLTKIRSFVEKDIALR